MALIPEREVPLRDARACIIRCACEEDGAAMTEHQGHMQETDPFTTRTPGELVRTLEEQRGMIAAHRAHPSQLLLVATGVSAAPGRRSGGLIGALRFAAGDRKRTCHSGHFGISVHADWRGRGVGSALIAAMLGWGASHPEIEKIWLGVLGGNHRARALYRRMGFVEEGLSPRHFKYGPDRYEDDVLMALYVKPGVAPPGFVTWREGDLGG